MVVIYVYYPFWVVVFVCIVMVFLVLCGFRGFVMGSVVFG